MNQSQFFNGLKALMLVN